MQPFGFKHIVPPVLGAIDVAQCQQPVVNMDDTITTTRTTVFNQYDWVPPFNQRYLKAYNMAGEQVCVAGVGTGSHFGTFPACWEVKQLTNTPGWMKVLACPVEDEEPRPGKHYELMQDTRWRPKEVLLNCSDGTSRRGHQEDRLGHGGVTHLTVLVTEWYDPPGGIFLGYCGTDCDICSWRGARAIEERRRRLGRHHPYAKAPPPVQGGECAVSSSDSESRALDRNGGTDLVG